MTRLFFSFFFFLEAGDLIDDGHQFVQVALNPCLTWDLTVQLCDWLRGARNLFFSARVCLVCPSLLCFAYRNVSIWSACPNQVAEAVVKSSFFVCVICTSCIFATVQTHAIGLCVRDRRAVAAAVAADGTRGLILYNKTHAVSFCHYSTCNNQNNNNATSASSAQSVKVFFSFLFFVFFLRLVTTAVE